MRWTTARPRRQSGPVATDRGTVPGADLPLRNSADDPSRQPCPPAALPQRDGAALAGYRTAGPCCPACCLPWPAWYRSRPCPSRCVPVTWWAAARAGQTPDGTRFDLSAQRRWVVLNSGHLVRALHQGNPELSALADRLDVVVLGLTTRRSSAGAGGIPGHPPAALAIAPVDPWQPPAGFPVPRPAGTYLVDTTGVVVQAWLGPVDQAMIEQAMREAARPGEARPDPAGADGAGTSTGPGGDD